MSFFGGGLVACLVAGGAGSLCRRGNSDDHWCEWTTPAWGSMKRTAVKYQGGGVKSLGIVDLYTLGDMLLTERGKVHFKFNNLYYL